MRRLPSITLRPRVHDEEVGTANDEVHELLHHSLGLNRLAETSESTLVARALPDSLRGSGFGVLGGVQALGDIVSTVTVGILYVVFSPFVAFAYAATWMLLSLSASSWLVASSRWTS